MIWFLKNKDIRKRLEQLQLQQTKSYAEPKKFEYMEGYIAKKLFDTTLICSKKTQKKPINNSKKQPRISCFILAFVHRMMLRDDCVT